MGVSAAAITQQVRRGHWGFFDAQLFLYMLLLVGFGIVIGYSVGYGEAAEGSPELGQVTRTVIWAAIGLVVYFVFAALDYRWLETFAVPIYLAVIGLLVLTMLAGRYLFGAQMSVSFAGLDFQFSEVSKVLMVVVLATYLTSRGRRVGRLSTILTASAIVALPTLLVFRQPDLGSSMVFIAILAGMLFMAGANLGWMALIGGTILAALPVAIGLLQEYQRARLFCFLDPMADPQGACYQLVQGLNAVGSGGWLGQGLTAGRQNQLGYLPVQSTDFVFTVVGEELGFAGSMVLLALFGLLIWRILRVGWNASDSLGMMVATGLASMILFQILVNVGMVIGLMPVTGIPLPFITYGGSSLVSLMFGLGILQSVRMWSHRATF